MHRAFAAEALGTALLLIAVVGSGIMGSNLAGGNTAIALLANAVATGCMLYALITVLGPVSGAHFNPAVTLAILLRREITIRRAAFYIVYQIVGGLAGVWLTHMMFSLPILQVSATTRAGLELFISELLATFGLLFVIFGGLKMQPRAVPTLVAIYITGAYWFTASTSFANPAVTIARSLSDTFSGIAPADAPYFIIAQLAAALLATPVLMWLFEPTTTQ